MYSLKFVLEGRIGIYNTSFVQKQTTEVTQLDLGYVDSVAATVFSGFINQGYMIPNYDLHKEITRMVLSSAITTRYTKVVSLNGRNCNLTIYVKRG